MKVLHWNVPKVLDSKLSIDYGLNECILFRQAPPHYEEYQLNFDEFPLKSLKKFNEVQDMDSRYSAQFSFFQRCFIHDYLELK